ncbi:hypothetical protein ABZZ74_53490 [Streptomyces sp. NPDC006476]|uniref:hypothetical protein n=1 Tax=Streptomyces sp. NPDC006476 TaxID=3157175 RepID=UPI0033AFB943
MLTLKVFTSRPERIKKIIAGLVVMGVAGVGVADSQSAYADSDFITWTLNVKTVPGNKALSFRHRWTDSSGHIGDVCSNISTPDSKGYNVTGLSDDRPNIQAYAADDCNGSVIGELSYTSPHDGSTPVFVTFDGSGVHLG